MYYTYVEIYMYVNMNLYFFVFWNASYRELLYMKSQIPPTLNVQTLLVVTDTYGTKGYQLVKMVDIYMYKNPKETCQYLLDYLLIVFGERYTYKNVKKAWIGSFFSRDIPISVLLQKVFLH